MHECDVVRTSKQADPDMPRTRMDIGRMLIRAHSGPHRRLSLQLGVRAPDFKAFLADPIGPLMKVRPPLKCGGPNKVEREAADQVGGTGWKSQGEPWEAIRAALARSPADGLREVGG